MEFTRKQVRGKNQKTYKEWRDESDNYRIVWRNEFMGLDLPDAFYATVRKNGPSGPYWDFVGARGPYRSFKKAAQAANKHRKAWCQLLEIAEGDRKGRVDRVRELDQRYRGSTRDGNYRLMMSMPAWVEGQVPTSIMQAL
jgi:hypothetical protein